MRTRFLLGPAGSGKTARCVDEVRSALKASPDGPPLLFIAPKQATFQLERQLLADPDLHGYTRLHILSFDRLARHLLELLGLPLPRLLAEEGRLMVLRALLTRHRHELTVFRATARLAGFAGQLNLTLRELQRHQVSAARLVRLAANLEKEAELSDKLRDLALMLERYLAWLKTHDLLDADQMLDVARDALPSRPGALRFGGLWLDGFAEMTPQELDLVAAVLPLCDQATLAFCLEDAPASAPHWLSVWSTVGDSYCRLRDRLAAMPRGQVQTEILPRDFHRSRFATSAPLRHLEAHWQSPAPCEADLPAQREAIRILSCAHPVQEVERAADEIERFVADAGGRYREAAVLVRSLEGYHALLRREFRRRGIPMFLDRREPVAHHPLVELTRNALRAVAFGWQHDDWFGALKTGLVDRELRDLDELENAALARGWSGEAWQRPLECPENPGVAARLEAVRQRIVPPFVALHRALFARGAGPNGRELAAALRHLWSDLEVPSELRRWAEAAGRGLPDRSAGVAPQIHREIWEQMQGWLENVALAFPSEPMSIAEWLPILEAGLANLTVGVIPPALDQVLVGTVDRSRNPDLRLTIFLGLNDGSFPAPAELPRLLSSADRTALEELGLHLGPDRQQQMGRERYYGYIGFTRSRERLVVMFSRRDGQDRLLQPSSFVAHLRRLFPALEVETHGASIEPAAVEAPAGTAVESLDPEIARRLYGPEVLRTSVSRLEAFAACPFKFFVSAGLRAEERKRFEVDARQRGSFLHEVLRGFHEKLVASGRGWRDVTPAAAREMVGEVAARVAAEFSSGIMQSDDGGHLNVRAMTRSLQRFVAMLVEWTRTTYAFQPHAAELAFGFGGSPFPAWEIALASGRRLAVAGKIDRVDLVPTELAGEAWCVIHDYKSSPRTPDRVLLSHGIQLQLPAYLAALCHVSRMEPVRSQRLGASNPPPESGAPSPGRDSPSPGEGFPRLRPAGFFYANLRGKFEAGKHRREVVGQLAAPGAYAHRGHFAFDLLPLLDKRPGGAASGQFAYRLKSDGQPWKTPGDPLLPSDLGELLAEAEATIRDLGNAIFAGVIAVDPYEKGGTKACDQCPYRALCRIDPWTHTYRRLRPKALLPNRPPGETSRAGRQP